VSTVDRRSFLKSAAAGSGALALAGPLQAFAARAAGTAPEDGGRHGGGLRGLTEDGELYDFAANIRPGTIPGSSTPQSFDEFAGATFSGDWMFVNIQTPGVTFAITGPWSDGPLG
jgi:hypothetical protein